MGRGKTINVYLIDGVAEGKVRATMGNWTGVVYKIPRNLLHECRDLDPFKQNGIYMLFDKDHCYVGQSEVRKNGDAIHKRISEHEKDEHKDEWDEVVMITTRGTPLEPTDLVYLENKIYNRVKDAGRYSLHQYEPRIGTIKEEKEDELEEFLENVKTVLYAVGYKAFDPAISYGNTEKKETIVVTSLEKKTDVLAYLKDKGIDIDGGCSYSVLNRNGAYTIDVQEELLKKDWTVVLNNTKKNVIQVYVVPKRVLDEYGLENFRYKNKHDASDKRKSIRINPDTLELGKVRTSTTNLSIAKCLKTEVQY